MYYLITVVVGGMAKVLRIFSWTLGVLFLLFLGGTFLPCCLVSTESGSKVAQILFRLPLFPLFFLPGLFKRLIGMVWTGRPSLMELFQACSTAFWPSTSMISCLESKVDPDLGYWQLVSWLWPQLLLIF